MLEKQMSALSYEERLEKFANLEFRTEKDLKLNLKYWILNISDVDCVHQTFRVRVEIWHRWHMKKEDLDSWVESERVS